MPVTSAAGLVGDDAKGETVSSAPRAWCAVPSVRNAPIRGGRGQHRNWDVFMFARVRAGNCRCCSQLHTSRACSLASPWQACAPRRRTAPGPKLTCIGLSPCLRP